MKTTLGKKLVMFMIAVATIIYSLSPVDLLPLNFFDDLIVIVLSLSAILKVKALPAPEE